MAYLDYAGLQRFWEQVKNRLDNKADKSEGQSDWSVNDATSPSYVKNRTHYDTILSKTLFDGTITATAGTLTRINSIPDEMIVNYPDVSVVRATFDGKVCTITATTNKWELRDPNGQLVFTMNYDTAKGAQCLVSTYAGSGAHTLVIEADEITAVPLDEKYIPDTIPRRTDIPKMAMPDWNASEGEAGYVKNRTHYEEKNVIVPNTIIDVPSSDLFAALPVLDTAIVAGNSYVVELDNEKYTCVAWADGDVIYLGNGNVYPGVNKGENVPFSIDTYPDKTAFLNTQVGKEYVVSIATPGNVKQLDEKFIPNSIARDSEVEARFNALVIPDELADLKADATHRTVTDTEKATWNAKSNFSGNYNDLTNKPTIPSIAGLATEKYVTDSLAETEQWVNDNFSTKGYVDNAVSSLIDTAPDTLNTLNELAAALGDDPNFATTVTNQLSNKVDKVTGKGLSTHDYTTDEKLLLAEIAQNYITSDDIADINTKIEAAHTHATTYKGSAFANGLYKITTNAEGHVTAATAVAKSDITALGIPAQDTDTGATSVEVTGAGNAITAASYDATSRKLTLTKGATYTNNKGTITGVNVGTSLSGGGTSGAVSISHVEGSAVNKTSGLYKFSTDATSHVKSVTAVTKADIVALGIPETNTTYTAITNAEIDAICGQL